MKNNILLFACIEKNIGDDLFIYTISNRYKNVVFRISAEAKYGTLKKLDNLLFDKDLEKWIKYSNYVSENIIKEFFRSILIKYYKRKVGYSEIAIYIVGNAFKNMRYHGKKDSRWLNERVDLVDRFYLLSTNFGPYTDKRWEKDCEDVFGRITDLCFRDKKSFDIFRSLPNVRCKPDAILSLGKRDHLNNNYIVVSMIDCKMSGRPEELCQASTNYEDKICEIVNHYTSLGKKVVLLNSNTLQDLPATKRVYSRIMNHNAVSIYNYEGMLEEVFDIFKNAEMVFATRLHTIILSWLYSVPVIPIIYDIKVKGLLDECCFDDFYINISDINSLSIDALQEIITNYKFELSEEIIKDANEQFELIDAELKGK